MRADMFKVIIERPRWGAGHASSPKLKRTRDQSLKHIGLMRHAFEGARYTKSLSENLAPLVRFLRSRCGQPWDSFFSEICAGLDTGSAVKMLVRQHLEDFVLTRISVGRYGEWLFEGEVLGIPKRWSRFGSFFVDPADGILRDSVLLAERLPEANRVAMGGRA